jgi:hypothetical protein
MTHPLCVAYKAMWNVLQSGMRDDIHSIIEYKGYVKPTQVMRSIQLQFWNWLTHRRNHLTPPQPDLLSILDQILLQLYVLPHLPPALYQLAYPKKPPHISGDNALIPGLIATGSASGSSASGSSSGSSDAASTISGLKHLIVTIVMPGCQPFMLQAPLTPLLIFSLVPLCSLMINCYVRFNIWSLSSHPGNMEGTDTGWLTWATFCHSIDQDPWLQDIADPMPLLQIYAHRYRMGQLAPSGSLVKA